MTDRHTVKYDNKDHPELNGLGEWVCVFFPRKGSNLRDSAKMAKDFLRRSPFELPQFVWEGKNWIPYPPPGDGDDPV